MEESRDKEKEAPPQKGDGVYFRVIGFYFMYLKRNDVHKLCM